MTSPEIKFFTHYTAGFKSGGVVYNAVCKMQRQVR